MIPAIRIEDLTVSYDRKRVLQNVYLSLQQGQLYGVIGPNGAGKSTLFKAILGLVDYSGDIFVLNNTIEKHRLKIAYVPQKDEVDWEFPATALDIVLMGRYPFKKLFQRINKKDINMALEIMEYLEIVDLKNRQIGQLSGGQQQRIFLARALLQDAEIMLLDEPFVGIDASSEAKIVEILKELSSEGKTLLVVHHDLETVEAYFDEVILLNQRLIGYGPVKSHFTKELVTITYASISEILQKTGMIKR